MTTSLPLHDDWTPEACTLPTVERPLRVAEFDDLFATALRGIERPEPTRLDLLLDGATADAAEDLTARESGCCAFFRFTFTPAADGLVRLAVAVPDAHVRVLDALGTRASATRAAAVRDGAA